MADIVIQELLLRDGTSDEGTAEIAVDAANVKINVSGLNMTNLQEWLTARVDAVEFAHKVLEGDTAVLVSATEVRQLFE